MLQAGQTFGRMTVLRYTKTNKHRARRYLCRCLCGNEKEVNGGDLNSGRVQSCGCLRAERASEATAGDRNYGYIHGGSGTKLHRLWRGMSERCSDPKHISYKYYGAKGVAVCMAWSDFDAFRTWANQHGYQDGMSVDRLDPTAGYEPDNCQIVTRAENTAKGNKARRKT